MPPSARRAAAAECLPMHRRLFTAAACAWAGSRALAQEARQPRQKISAGELFRALSARFPLRLSLAGLLQLQVDAAGLLLMPARQKLGATLAVQGTGLAARQFDRGELDLVFSLRYERSDRTLRAHDPELLDMRWPGLPPDARAGLRGTLPAATSEVLGDVVLHEFTARELALPDAMGFEPGRIDVADDGIVITFQPKK